MAIDQAFRAGGQRDPATVAIDHVRLAYHYLDAGDLDGYLSLFEEQCEVCGLGAVRARRREELERFERRQRAAGAARHTIFNVLGAGRVVVALGQVARQPAAIQDRVRCQHFVDVFAVSEHAMITRRQRFLEEPRTPPAGER